MVLDCKITTVYIPRIYLNAIKKILIQYSSVSEFVRVAVKNQLIRDLVLQEALTMTKEAEKVFEKIREASVLKRDVSDLEKMRGLFPELPDYKYMNERLDFQITKLKDEVR